MVDPAIFQIGSIKNMKEYCLVSLYTNFHNFSQMCRFITLWSPTIEPDKEKVVNIIMITEPNVTSRTNVFLLLKTKHV